MVRVDQLGAAADGGEIKAGFAFFDKSLHCTPFAVIFISFCAQKSMSVTMKVYMWSICPQGFSILKTTRRG